MDARRLFIHNSKERKDRIVYMSVTAALAVQQHLAIRPDSDFVHLFTTQQGALHPRSLQRRLVHYAKDHRRRPAEGIRRLIRTISALTT
jgi:integrase